MNDHIRAAIQRQNETKKQKSKPQNDHNIKNKKHDLLDKSDHLENKRRRIDFQLGSKPETCTLSSMKETNRIIISPSQHEMKTEHKSQDPGRKVEGANGSTNPKVSLFDVEIVKKLLAWNSVKKVGPGFYNDGNSCYLNSTLQCLLYIPALTQLFLSEGEILLKRLKRSGNSNSDNNNNISITELYHNLVKEVWLKSNHLPSIAPRGMVCSIRRVGKQFKPFRQEDAHEYLRQLLDCMHEEVLKSHNLKTSTAGKIAETTFISRVFGGNLCNTVACTQCPYVSRSYNTFQDLSLDIRSNKIQSVQDAIRAFVQPEYLTAGNEWRCEKCKNKVKAKKQMVIAEVPNVLVLHLKRFAMGGFFAKNTRHIQFSPTLLLPKENSSQSVKYDLTGVVVHHGSSTHSGHYIAYIKAPNGTWHEMNDSHVSTVSLQRVLQAQAYVLFYSRQQPQPQPQQPSQQQQQPMNGKPAESNKINNIVKTKQDDDDGEKVEVNPSKPVVTTTAITPNAIQNKKSDAKTLKTEITRGSDVEESDEESDDDDNDDDDSDNDDDDDLMDFPLRFRQPMRWRGALGKFYCKSVCRNRMPLRQLRREDSDSDHQSDDHSDHTSEEHALNAEDETSSDHTSESDDNRENRERETTQMNIPTNTSTLSKLLEISRKGRTLGSAGVWDHIQADDRLMEQTQKIATLQKRADQHARKQNRLSDWDQLLDGGRKKKVKAKKEDQIEQEESNEKFNPFQRFAEEKFVKK